MKLKCKLKPKIISEINELNSSRGEVNNFILNFINNVCERTFFVHEYLRKNKDNENGIRHLTAMYITSLVTCWETFFRDTVSFIVNTDNDSNLRAIKFLESKNIKQNEIDESGINLGDFISKQFNFQNLEGTLDAFNFLFDESKSDIIEYLPDNFMEGVIYKNINYLLILADRNEDVLSNIKNIIEEAFIIRHNIIHNANYKFKVDFNYIYKLEDCLILFPQFIAIQICNRYNQGLACIDTENNCYRITNKLKPTEEILIFSSKDLSLGFQEA